MDSNFTSRPQKLSSDGVDHQNQATLVLYNDDSNTFDYVMEVLVEICDHSLTQAEQCATITHFKGRCEVRTGTLTAMKELRYQLISRGLKAIVDN
ncbi:MAG: ATP-dependent Clp protease adaptor ClpS [Bacteroidales bacterium]|nr:ATP-dependent Clp protease adaptor ClpS [Bacteroidota bacterium]MCK4989667.1 ATP-dependent Clp protease adaptor ClpS [Bacteroidales bacterium]